MAIRKLFSIFLVLCHTACWDTQDIDLLKPEVPQYSLSGFTLDMDDSTLVLQQTPITLTADQMLYDVSFTPLSIESDTTGYYQIDSVYPGNYTLTAERNGYTIVEEKIAMGHEDKSMVLELPKPFLTYSNFRGPSTNNPIFTFNNNSNTFWGMGYTVSPRPPQVYIQALLQYQVDSYHINFLRWIHTPFNDPKTVTLVYGIIYFYKNNKLITLRPEDQNIWQLVILDSTQIEAPITDMVWDGSGFWTTFGQSLQYRGNNLSNVEDSWQIGADQVGALVVQDQNLWVYDQGRDLLLKLNDEKQIVESYRLINWDTGEWISVFDMSINTIGTLWVTDQNTTPLLHIFDFRDINNNP